jgi:hydrogenase nickel incorporation protein HypA/HybF
MHETGIAEQILERAAAVASGHPGAAIQAVHVRIGALSGVVAEALEFAFDCLKRGTPAASARLLLEAVPLVARCPACQSVSHPGPDLVLWCARCGAPLEVVSGEELDLVAVDLGAAAPTPEEAPCPASP